MVEDTLSGMGLAEASAKIRSGEISSVALTHALLARIDALNPSLHAYVLVLADEALAAARAADEALARNEWLGPLHGIPLAVKDLCWMRGLPTAAGTSVLRDSVAPQDATVVARLRAAGSVLLGKTSMTEGAYSDYHPSVTPVVNPWDAAYWTGISSSGSAVATAAGLCFGALASDTGGSIRWPSAANGMTGLKPTWGRVSRHGIVPLAPSLDHVGTIARSVEDVAAIIDTITGPDPLDPTAALLPSPDLTSALDPDLRGMKIGIDRYWNEAEVDAETARTISEALAVFRELGAAIVEIQFPDVTQAVQDWVPNCAVEVAVVHEEMFRANAEAYGPILASVIRAGQALSGMDYQRILLRRADFRGRVEALFADVDVIAMPVQPFAPLSLTTIATLGDQPELIAGLQRYTCPFDMSGHPALTLPAGFSSSGLPIGMQLVAGHFHEAKLIKAGHGFQTNTQWHLHRPALGTVRTNS